MSTVTLKSSDAQTFQIPDEVAFQSETIKNMLEDTESDAPVPIPSVEGTTLAKVIEYCEFHKESNKTKVTPESEKQWTDKYLNIEQKPLFDLILAANYLNIKPLLDLGCKRVADMIKGKTPEEIRQTFGIENDFTKEEEDAIRKENAWAYE